jgi:murein DD-endopeptidase MepM/ murein hydrolase activator NlpD
MQIILLHSRFNAKSLTLNHWHLIGAGAVFFASVILAASFLYYLTFRHAASLGIPAVRDMIASATQHNADKKDQYIKENLTAMAVKLGEMQAQLMRLDALGERVQGLAGVKPQEFNFKELPGRGGSEQTSEKSDPLSMNEFRKELDATARSVEYRADYMNVIETTLMGYKIRSRLLPTIQPVEVSYNASSFGWRLDPFSGRRTFHEGIDFAAMAGTPIVAAAGGVIIAAEYHHQYGNMVEVDHGNDIVTRYAHASRLRTKVGDIVRRGQHIADVGSTGRSTGAHLHFEVLVKRVPQNPHKFLAAGSSQAKLAALVSK